MGHDYYKILGVTPAANFDAIKRAFRARVKEHHPDRPGGSHEAMILVTEAWEILSDPDRRRRYDAARVPAAALVVRESAAEDARQAHEQAEHYPRQWAEVERWLNMLASDFTDARYGEVHVFGGYSIPTAGDSVSGFVFIVMGAAVGLVVSVPLFFWLQQNHVSMNPWVLAALAAPPLGGAWIGSAVHRAVGARVSRIVRGRTTVRDATTRNVGSTATAERPSRVVVCACKQKLRVPGRDSTVQVRCTACGRQFDVAP